MNVMAATPCAAMESIAGWGLAMTATTMTIPEARPV